MQYHLYYILCKSKIQTRNITNSLRHTVIPCKNPWSSIACWRVLITWALDAQSCKLCWCLKVRQNRNNFFKLTFPPKNEQTNSILLLWDLCSFVFLRKLTFTLFLEIKKQWFVAIYTIFLQKQNSNKINYKLSEPHCTST